MKFCLFSLSSSRRCVFIALGKRSHKESPRGIEFSDPFVVSFSLSVRKESEREFRALRRRSQFTMFLFDLYLSLSSLPPTPLRAAFVFRRTHRNFLSLLG